MDTKKETIFHHWKNFLKNIREIFTISWKEDKWKLIGYFIGSTCVALVPVFQSYANKVLVNGVIEAVTLQNLGHLWFVVVILAIAYTTPGVFYSFNHFFERSIFFTLNKVFDLAVESKRSELDILQYEDSKFNNFVNRVNEKGIWVIGNMTTTVFYDYQSIITILMSAAVVGFYSPVILFLLILSSIPQLILNTKFANMQWYLWGDDVNAEERRKYWAVKGTLSSISDITEVKLFNLKRNFIMRLSNFIERIKEIQNKNNRKKLVWSLVTNILGQSAVIFGILYMIRDAIEGTFSIGSIVLVAGVMASFQNSLAELFTSLGRNHEDRKYLHDLLVFLKIQPAIVDGKQVIDFDKAPEISFNAITFSYPNSEKKIYDNFSLTIKRGEKIAIIGLNGAGKTTLVKLLCRFYDPTKGSVTIGGINLKDIKKRTWYDHIGVLFQDFAKYKFTTIGELISLGDIHSLPNDGAVQKAGKQADAESFIKAFPKGYEQQLGKEFTDGVDPSGGQWQKLAIARLFYRNPKIWILDEPTAAVDADAEAKIFSQLEKLPRNTTVILISHRFSTVRTADRIVVIDAGKVREQGTHEELMAMGGEYARLFSLQAEGYK